MSDSELQRSIDEPGRRLCPWCAESIRVEAVKCRHCGSVLDESGARILSEPWLRPREGRMVAGVCAGLAEQFGLSVTIVRLAFALGAFFSAGLFLVVYLALWLAMPEGHRFAPGSATRDARDRYGTDAPG